MTCGFAAFCIWQYWFRFFVHFFSYACNFLLLRKGKYLSIVVLISLKSCRFLLPNLTAAAAAYLQRNICHSAIVGFQVILFFLNGCRRRNEKKINKCEKNLGILKSSPSYGFKLIWWRWRRFNVLQLNFLFVFRFKFIFLLSCLFFGRAWRQQE